MSQKQSQKQENFIFGLRNCAADIAAIEKREEVLTEVANLFTEVSEASAALIIDFSREKLDLYRSTKGGSELALTSTAVILEESIGPLLELIQDRYIHQSGIKVANKQIVNPLENVDKNVLSAALDELGINQGFIIPLMISRNYGAENLFGILIINDVPSHLFADPAHLALLRLSADFLTLTADNMDMGNALARLKPTDQTTGLASRNRLLSTLAQELNRCEYLNSSFAILHADIDRLKELNSQDGYRYGDLVIKTVADLLLAESRPIDTVSRWAGEEYLILMPETGAENALEFAERCRKRINQEPITPDDYHQEIFVSISIGISLYPEHGTSTDILLRNAELALLHSKLNGRNQSSIWTESWKLAEQQEEQEDSMSSKH